MASGLSLLLTGDGKGGLTAIRPALSGIAEPGDAKSLTLTDLNADGRPDLVFGLNSAPVKVLLASAQPSSGTFVAVRLKGKTGNATAIGALVTLTTSDGKSQTAEVQAGSGYLSQGTTALTFGLPAGTTVKALDVHWPGGQKATYAKPAVKGQTIELSAPKG